MLFENKGSIEVFYSRDTWKDDDLKQCETHFSNEVNANVKAEINRYDRVNDNNHKIASNRPSK